MHVDREDVAIKVNDIAPGQFNWRKYPERIDVDAVSGTLRTAKKPQNGGLAVEYAIALPYEKLEKDELYPAEDALFDVKETIDRVTKRFMEHFHTAGS